MKFIEYIIGRFTIQPKNYIKGENGQREKERLDDAEGMTKI